MKSDKIERIAVATLQQDAILDTKQVLAYIKPISHHRFWNVVVKDPRFPKPILGGNGAKAIYGREAIDDYLKEVARTGFQNPDGSKFTGHEKPEAVAA